MAISDTADDGILYFLTGNDSGKVHDLETDPETVITFAEPGRNAYVALRGDAAIVTDQSNKIVMTVTGDGTVVPKPIRPGPIIDGLRVVREGLKADDNVIINGLVRARPGGKVTPQPGEIKPDTQASN